MSTQNTTATTADQSPLARLIEGKPVHTQDGHDIVALTDPTCPLCGEHLLLRRVEVREVFHPLRSAEVYDGGLGLTADVVVRDEAESDECINVQSDTVVCTAGCTFEISGNDVNVDWA